MKGVAIIDFDNWFKKDLAEYSDAKFEFEMRDIIDYILKLDSRIDEIELRLYNGWYLKEILTKKASQLQMILSRINLFPYKLDMSSGKIIKGKIEIVSSLYSIPTFTWFNTLKEKNGISSLRIDQTKLTGTCHSQPHLCPAKLLKKFTKKKVKQCHVSGCSIQHSDLFIGLEQKMVDTMIACDIISFCEDPECEAILVVSEDIDHFPAIAKGKMKLLELGRNSYLGVLIRNTVIQPQYDSILGNFGLKTLLAT